MPNKVLIVDDSPYNLFVLQELIESLDLGIEVETAINGQEAVDTITELHQKGENYDMVLMDLHMPILDGFQVKLHY